MITEICMKNVASFKQATLNTDKRINLIYGLNGVGKSTIFMMLINLVFLTVVIQVHLKILSLFIIKNLYMIIFLFKIV